METRTIKELLQIMLDNWELFETGLCCLSDTLYFADIITSTESYILDDFLNEHTPHTNHIECYGDGYWWPSGDWKPRAAWLRRHIRRLSE